MRQKGDLVKSALSRARESPEHKRVARDITFVTATLDLLLLVLFSYKSFNHPYSTSPSLRPLVSNVDQVLDIHLPDCPGVARRTRP